ncbi:MAG: hypothetical protein ACTSVY_06645 [Candidatus Helarchaeota archaeon]
MTEKIVCSKCGKNHEVSRHNFDDWIVCNSCGAFLCDECSNIKDQKNIQNLFLWNIVSFLLFYIGISISLMSFEIITFSSLIIFMIIGFVLISSSYLIYISIYVMTQKKKLNEENVINKCSCGGSYKLYIKDLISQFWFVSIFIYLIVHVIFQFAFILYESYLSDSQYPYPANDIIPILISLIAFIIIGIVFTLSERKNLFKWERHKSPIAFIRTFQVFFVTIACVCYTNIFNSSIIFYFNQLLLYDIFAKLSFLYPAFILNVIFYLLVKKSLTSFGDSSIKQFMMGFLFINVPYFIWIPIQLFIQNIWGFINYGIISGFILGFLFTIGIDNMISIYDEKRTFKPHVRLTVVFIMIALVTTYLLLKELIHLSLLNVIFAFVFLIIPYVGLELEFFRKGNKTPYFGRLNKNDYSYYIILGFLCISLFSALETFLNTSNLINNELFLNHWMLNVIFITCIVIGMISAPIIKQCIKKYD